MPSHAVSASGRRPCIGAPGAKYVASCFRARGFAYVARPSRTTTTPTWTASAACSRSRRSVPRRANASAFSFACATCGRTRSSTRRSRSVKSPRARLSVMRIRRGPMDGRAIEDLVLDAGGAEELLVDGLSMVLRRAHEVRELGGAAVARALEVHQDGMLVPDASEAPRPVGQQVARARDRLHLRPADPRLDPRGHVRRDERAEPRDGVKAEVVAGRDGVGVAHEAHDRSNVGRAKSHHDHPTR